jgi:branched-chain amino acid aminotransferase/4-amino-4-deoxychorismate lyase
MMPLDDRGLLLGDGLFETLLAQDGELVWLEAHLDRLAAGCEVLGLPPPDRAGAVQAMALALVQDGLAHGRAAVRLTLTAGPGGRGLDRPESLSPRLFATAQPAPGPPGPARLATSAVRRNAGSPASRLKTLAYLDNVLARREARDAGAEEALMLNTDGLVACAGAANLFWIADGRLFTPALDCGVLAGIARARTLAAAAAMGVETVEAHAGPPEVAAAEAVMLTNSLIGVRQVCDWNGRVYPPSLLAARLAAELWISSPGR